MLSHRIPGDVPANAWSRRLAERRAAGAGLLDLADLDPTRLGLSPLAEAAAALARVGVPLHHPEALGEHAARAAIAAHLAAAGARVAPERIALTSSTSESYAQLFRLLCDPGGAVLAPAPSYPLFEPLARAEGIKIRPYRLAFDGAWHLDRDSLARAAPGARAIILVEPNPPTGSCLEPDERAFVESLAERHGLAIVSDEVFAEYPRPPRTDRLGGWLQARRVPTFVLGGLSKLCGLPQLKLG